MGYVDGTIPKPPPTLPSTTPATSVSTSTPAAPVATPIYSTTPSLDEWLFRDQLARGHIALNCIDTGSLGVKTTGTAKEAWDSIMNEWGKSTDMRRFHAQEALNRTEYVEGTDIQEHIKLLRTRKIALDNLSPSVMSEDTWKGIIVRSIPPTTKWLPVIPVLYSLTTSSDIFSMLVSHGMILDRGAARGSSSASGTALAARTTEGCKNPNCKARKKTSHTTDNCYWPGGGKEGQFPPNFGQKSKANATTASTPTPDPTIPSQTEHFVLSARVPATPGQSGVLLDDPINPRAVALISQGFQSFEKGKIPTFMDSGASDTMFVSRDAFTEYKQVSSRVGDSAKAKDGNFEIVGEGNVVQRYNVDGKDRKITYTRALHTPTLNANLVSVSALDRAGITTTFGNGKGIAKKADGTVVLTGKNVNGMYLLETLDNKPDTSFAMTSTSHPTSMEQWHRRLSHCSPSTIQEMATKNLVDGLKITETSVSGRCEDCIMGRQTRRPFDGETEKDLEPLELVSFDIWGPSRVQSAGGKVYLLIIVDAGTSYKHGAYLADKSDATTLAAFDEFRAKVEALTGGKKVRRVRSDGAFESPAWQNYYKSHSILHEISAPYSSAQNGLAERAIRTTIEDVRTLLSDSGLGHSYWAEAAAYSIHTRNLIPSRRHPTKIPLESLTGRRQGVSHLRVFGSSVWAKIPTVHGTQVTGGSKLDPRSVACRFLGYALGAGNYKVQDLETRRVFVSRDVIFEEGHPRRTSASVGEQIPLFDMIIDDVPPADHDKAPDTADNSTRTDVDHVAHQSHQQGTVTTRQSHQQSTTPDIAVEPRRSTRASKPSEAKLQSIEYKEREGVGKGEGQDWATDHGRPQASITVNPTPITVNPQASITVNPTPITVNPTSITIDPKIDHEDVAACLTDTKASHFIPRSYKEAMTVDAERWTIPMKAEMETLKSKQTWELVKPPPGANIMESKWVYDIKWDGEGNRIKDKARLVGKGYTQQFGVDYNETWAAVTRLESVRMTAAIAAKHDLKLWRIDFVAAYLNSVTKEDIYMRQAEGFVEPGKEDMVYKLMHTIYGTMQGGHDWYETLSTSYDKMGYTTSRADPCVRIKKEDGNYTLTNTYTDDTNGASNNDEEIKRRKEEISKIWEIRDVGGTEYFLGMRVQQDLELGTVRLTQRPYWEHFLNRFSLTHVTPRNTPLPVGIVLDNNMSPKTDSERKLMSDKPYRPVLGSVMWGQLATRPDLAFSVSLLARFQSNPGVDHWNALMHVVGYIKNTLDLGLTYSRDSDISPMAYVDADYGGCRDTRRSTSGYVFIMAGGAVTWSSKRQATVALSTVEAEYVAMSRCAQQMLWMHSWLSEVEIEFTLPGVIKGDNRGAIALTKNTKDHGKVKHIDMRHHYIRELLKAGNISIEQVSSADNLADLFTKPLPRDHHHRLLAALDIK